MAKLPEKIARTVARLIYERHERDATDWRRDHLGASLIGRECSRRLWYGFRWAAPSRHDGRKLRLFERGDREELWLLDELRAAGLEVSDIDPATGQQWRCSWLGGHFGGSADGAVLGVPAAPKTWHLLECKTSNAKRFAALAKSGVRVAQPEHLAQMQVLGLGLELTRALYLAVCKDDDQIHEERVTLDRAHGERLVAKAEQIVFAPSPLAKISDDPTHFLCKLCEHHDHCQAGDVARLERGCRTCVSATPEPDGTWTCAHHQTTLSPLEQRQGCQAHVLIPGLLPWRPVDASETERFVRYEDGKGRVYEDRGCELKSVAV